MCDAFDVNYQARVVRHANFGGATNGSHMLWFKGIRSTVFNPPAGVPRTLKHLLNAAAPTQAEAITRPPAIQGAIARTPLVVEDLLRREGLYDVHRPMLLIACPSGFTPTKWVGRRLTCYETLWAFDVPISMDTAFEANVPVALQRTITPLVVTAIFGSLWAEEGGLVGLDGSPLDNIAEHSEIQNELLNTLRWEWTIQAMKEPGLGERFAACSSGATNWL